MNEPSHDKADCVFCKIVAGELPSTKVYEDDQVYAFADIHPVNLGHTVIATKKHYQNVYDTPEEALTDLMKAAKKIAVGAKEALKADGVNLRMNNDPASGQIIFHTHIHIIPRYTNDGLHDWRGGEYPLNEIRAAGEKVSLALS